MKCIVKSWTDKLFQSAVSQDRFHLSTHEIAIPNLPAAFHGFTLAQISDLHLDRWNLQIVEAAIDVVNNLNADLIVCTGDAISEGKGYLADLTHLLKQFHGHYGKLACLGNHDYSDGDNSFGVRKALGKSGFDVLINESTVLTNHYQKIYLAGADDLILGRQCLKTTTAALEGEQPLILLSHNPENFDAMACFKPDLILSGHTHGGQIHAPESVHRHFLGSPYIAGLYKSLSSQLYVNRGLGSTVFVHHLGKRRIAVPTPRWAVRPEISFFTVINPEFEASNLKPEFEERLIG